MLIFIKKKLGDEQVRAVQELTEIVKSQQKEIEELKNKQKKLARQRKKYRCF